jgi:hypothetical protein
MQEPCPAPPRGGAVDDAFRGFNLKGDERPGYEPLRDAYFASPSGVGKPSMLVALDSAQ